MRVFQPLEYLPTGGQHGRQDTLNSIGGHPEQPSEDREIMGLMHTPMEANDLALAKMIADNNQALAKILQHVVDVATGTERMTSEILTRLASS